MKKAELVLIPAPRVGHFFAMAEFAESLLERDNRLSVTILLIQRSGGTVPELEAKIQSLAASDTQIRCINIPPVDVEPPSSLKSSEKYVSDFIESHKSHVEDAIRTQLLSDDSIQITGIVVDLFCSSMIDIAHQLNIPSYLFFTCNAAFLGFMLYLPIRHSQVGGKQFDPSDDESIIPSYANRVPTNVVPSFAFDKEGYMAFVYHGTRFRQTKGCIVNTFAELEPYAVNSMMTTPPPIYPVGPRLHLNATEKSRGFDKIKTWLDDQPWSSVVFLCFGSRGYFDAPQLDQIAIALEGSGQQFLWSMRRPPPKGSLEMPTEYHNFQEVLPDGFLERTEKRGIVCGWVPQVEVLAHPAIGGFVSHCGWNSVMESIWYGVPTATWPLYAEQQINAFQLVRELGLAVELILDYRLNSKEVVMADVIERSINLLMDNENPVRKRVKEMSEKSRKALVEGGSSYVSVGRLIDDFLGNIKAVDT